jgi:MFS family permease
MPSARAASAKGSAVALVSSGQYMAGALWPLVLQLAVGTIGWRSTMRLYGVLVMGTIVPLAAGFFRTPPNVPSLNVARAKTGTITASVLGLPPNLVLGLLALAIFCCCVTMAMPLCRSRPGTGGAARPRRRTRRAARIRHGWRRLRPR